MKKSKIFLLESNVDDLTPEEVAHVVERLMDEGARDVHVLSCLMKKGRPGFLFRVLCDDPERFSHLLMVESGSLGVRFSEWDRFEAERKVREVEVDFGGVREKIRVKDSEFGSKPEFDDLRRIAEKHKLTLREARKKIEDLL